MDLHKLCGALRRGSVDAHRCLGCGYEHNCSIHGCQIMKQAADLLEDMQKQVVQASAEKQACFRLGQLDMRESIVTMLQHAADGTSGLTRAALRIAVDMIKGVEV